MPLKKSLILAFVPPPPTGLKMKPGSGHSHCMNDISLSAMQGTVLKDYITFKFEMFPQCHVGVLEVFCNSRNFPFNAE